MTELLEQIKNLDAAARAVIKAEIEALEPKLADFVSVETETGLIQGIVLRKGSKYSIQTTLLEEAGFKTISTSVDKLTTIAKEDFLLPSVTGDALTVFAKASYIKNGRKYYGFVFDTFNREEQTYIKLVGDDTVSLKAGEVSLETEIKDAEIVDQREALLHDLKGNQEFKEIMSNY